MTFAVSMIDPSTDCQNHFRVDAREINFHAASNRVDFRIWSSIPDNSTTSNPPFTNCCWTCHSSPDFLLIRLRKLEALVFQLMKKGLAVPTIDRCSEANICKRFIKSENFACLFPPLTNFFCRFIDKALSFFLLRVTSNIFSKKPLVATCQ